MKPYRIVTVSCDSSNDRGLSRITGQKRRRNLDFLISLGRKADTPPEQTTLRTELVTYVFCKYLSRANGVGGRPPGHNPNDRIATSSTLYWNPQQRTADTGKVAGLRARRLRHKFVAYYRQTIGVRRRRPPTGVKASPVVRNIASPCRRPSVISYR